MKKKNFILMLFFFCISSLVYGQTQVEGKVIDENGNPVEFATVIVVGKAGGTQSNPDGNFTISLNSGDVVEAGAIGYNSARITYSGQARLTFVLNSSNTQLDEIVVTAMGIKKEKKALGYAVQDINSEDLMKNKSANMVNSLAGKIAGVNITQTSGGAGAGASIILRGGTSLERDNQPLFVVDGVIYDNSTSINGNSGFDGAQPTNSVYSNRVMDINPEDIENVSVLKGPAAAALYGSRAAAGVVVITTKRGREGRATVNFNWLCSIML